MGCGMARSIRLPFETGAVYQLGVRFIIAGMPDITSAPQPEQDDFPLLRQLGLFLLRA